MRIGVQGDPDFGMPKALAYDFGVDAVAQELGRVGVTEIVKPDTGQIGSAEGRLGACIDLSMVLSRILDAEGIWNYVVKGSLTLTFPRSVQPGPIYFWPIDEGDFQAGQA